MKLRIADCALRQYSGRGLRIETRHNRLIVPSICASLITAILLSAWLSVARADEVYSKNKKGNELYKKGSYEDALKQYDDALLLAPSDTLLKMNKGSALYRLGKLDEAESEYNTAVNQGSKKKQADAHYNLGNIQFRQGDALAQGGQQGAMEKYKSALDHYIKALDLQPYNKDAKWNIELAQRRIKMQEQQQKQDNQKSKDDKKNEDKNQQNQNQEQKQDKKEEQDKDKKDQENKQDQNKKDQDEKKKDEQEQNRNQDNQNKEQQQPHPQPQQSKEDMKKQEAKRIIAQFADDADSLNRPPDKKGKLLKMKKPEKDW